VADLTELMRSLDTAPASDLVDDSAFTGLLSLTNGLSNESVLLSFRHETLGEYLMAHDILTAFSGSAGRLADGLRVTVGDDVNTFVRSGMNVASRPTVQRYLSNLTTRYGEFRPGLQLAAGSIGV
jgi:hypothetical protein